MGKTAYLIKIKRAKSSHKVNKSFMSLESRRLQSYQGRTNMTKTNQSKDISNWVIAVNNFTRSSKSMQTIKQSIPKSSNSPRLLDSSSKQPLQALIFHNKSTKMKLSDYVDPKRCLQLLTGVLGIFFSYLASGLLHEAMMKSKYSNNFTNQEEVFTWPSGFLIFPCGATWIIGAITNHFKIKPYDRSYIPSKKSAICGFIVAISTITYNEAIYLTNYPIVTMVKSCNLISVILVGALCSRVKDKKMRLEPKKIVVGAIITVGIIIFRVFDPESNSKSEQQTEVQGIILLVISLLADGFLPDFQAQIKSKYKPLPMQMMTEINKWVCIIGLLYSCVMLEIVDIFQFLFQHKIFALHMLLMGVLSTIGQMFVYRMIKQFKQHFPPFVITTRRIFTVGLSILYYKHQSNALQFLGLILVFALTTYEFVSELVNEKNKCLETDDTPPPIEDSIVINQTGVVCIMEMKGDEVQNLEEQISQKQIKPTEADN